MGRAATRMMKKHKPACRSSQTRAHDNRWLLVFLAVQLVLSVLLFDPKPDTGGDNAMYLALAKSMVEQGRYAELQDPAEPAHTQYPPGFPALLALVHVVAGGTSVLGAKLVVMLCGLGMVFFLYRITGRLFPDRHRLVMAGMMSLPAFAVASHQVLTEMPFLCLSMAALWFLLRTERGKPGDHWAAMVLVVVAFMFRTAGIALVLGTGLFLGLRRKWRYLGLFAALFLAALLPWQLRNSAVGQTRSYLDMFFAKHPYIAEYGRMGVGDFLGRVWDNLVSNVTIVVPEAMLPLFKLVKQEFLLGAAGVLLSLAVIAGFLRRAKKRTALEAYGFFAVLVLLAWPALWAGERFLVPLLPLAVIYLFFAVQGLEKRLGRKWLFPVVTGVLVLANAVSFARLAAGNVRHNVQYLEGDRLAGYPADWRRYFKVIEWLDGNVADDAVVLARKPEFVYLLAGNKSVCYPFTDDRARVQRAIDRSDYILFDNFQWTETTRYFLNPAIQFDPDRYPILIETDAPQFYLLRVLGPGVGGQGPGAEG